LLSFFGADFLADELDLLDLLADFDLLDFDLLDFDLLADFDFGFALFDFDFEDDDEDAAAWSLAAGLFASAANAALGTSRATTTGMTCRSFMAVSFSVADGTACPMSSDIRHCPTSAKNRASIFPFPRCLASNSPTCPRGCAAAALASERTPRETCDR
jgi:hypothetical protein